MEEHPEKDWRRLTRYMSGEHPHDEEEALQAWIVEDEKRARLMDDLKQVWDATERPAVSRNAEAAWQKLSPKLGRSEFDMREEERGLDAPVEEQALQVSGFAPSSKRPRYRRPRRSFSRRTAAVAVIATAALLTALLWAPLGSSPAEGTQVFATERGQRATLRLSDGTQVRLNVDSRLVLPAVFDTGERREVRLEGQAYFEVARDAARPFLVHTPRATVRVLGTAFDVQAYADDEEVQVAVTEGEVTLEPEEKALGPAFSGAPSDEEQPSERGQRRSALVLRPRQLGVVSEGRLLAVRQGIDLAGQMAWTKGQLVFEDAPFSEVVRKLERWYDLRIEAPHVTPEEVDQLNATFDDEPLREAIQAVAAALDLQYERDGRVILFSPAGSKTPAGSPLAKNGTRVSPA